jgi:hypothetical protein
MTDLQAQHNSRLRAARRGDSTMNESIPDLPLGGIVKIGDESFYAIRHVDKMPPFFINLVSDCDLWLFIASNGGLTAGRVSPDKSLFPYITVDKLYDSIDHSGSKTLIRVDSRDAVATWEPFNPHKDGLFHIERHLYKSLLGNTIVFEEINHDLMLVFRLRWMTSDEYGIVRECELVNTGTAPVSLDLLDGLLNILPAGTPRLVQNQSSYLIDAYKWSELIARSGLAMYTLFSAISDRAEPCESLTANTVFCSGLDNPTIALSATQIDAFRRGKAVKPEHLTRGVRGAYLVSTSMQLAVSQSRVWRLLADVDQTQGEVLALSRRIVRGDVSDEALRASIAAGSDRLARIMAASDGFQSTGDHMASAHHYANVVYNVLRGGIFPYQYHIDSADLARDVRNFNRDLYSRHLSLFDSLPASLPLPELQSRIDALNDPALQRLCNEYLPITFGRRHGDPSRPWNEFAIDIKARDGSPLLTYQGNWRDIFQNWEALALSYPEFIESMIAKFVNASTLDGYNPYRITKQGIDWEVEEPDDPWSYIGYWGDHQIIYLLKLLELSRQYHPGRLNALLRSPVFCYANVPYRIKPFESMLQDAKHTVEFDEALAAVIDQRCEQMGQDGKLVPDEHGRVYQVNLMEKLLVPMLSKLGNLVIDGGIWMNTQRPEWNDANNALVGQGLSVVTLCYLRRYVHFLIELVEAEEAKVLLTREVAQWISETALAMDDVARQIEAGNNPSHVSYRALLALGQAASRYRQAVYQQDKLATVVVYPLTQIKQLLADSLQVVDYAIQLNHRDDGLYHAYNLLKLEQDHAQVLPLYPMLEGQVAVLSSGTLTAAQAIAVIEALFDSAVYRADQNSFMLYPERELPGFLQKNVVPAFQLSAHNGLSEMIDRSDFPVLVKDEGGNYRFCADLTNAARLRQRLDQLAEKQPRLVANHRQTLMQLYEQVFRHREFTGRSGGMFGFEGLGCIYWHMVSKLLLAVQESYFRALDRGASDELLQRLAELYYRVRAGIGFNKTPAEYGAFPLDPYSHTPAHAGAQQPGMTGQVKEEILTRLGELGVRVSEGRASLQPRLLRRREFHQQPAEFRYLDVAGNWQTIELPAGTLAFSWCQVAVVYHLDETRSPGIEIEWSDQPSQALAQLLVPAEVCREIFGRSGRVRRLDVVLTLAEILGADEV